MELDTKHYIWKLEEKMRSVMEEPVSCRNAEMLSILIKAWHDLKSMEGHDSMAHESK